jgi:aldehyde dehydrogenase (NAD+)
MSDTVARSVLLPFRPIIGDTRPETASGGVHEHVNPATGTPQQTVPLAGVSEVDEAVASASKALVSWRTWTGAQRRQALFRVASLIREQAADLSTLVSLEIGLPASQAPWIVEFAAEWTESVAGWADKLTGATLPVESGETTSLTLIEPLGVIGLITTWNGSFGAFGMAVAPALAAGCTVVVKPSELAPFGMIRIGELCLEAGIPPGVVNIVPGGSDAGRALVEHPGVNKIAFTGSALTARSIAAACASTLKPCSFELGGKSPIVVFDDADLAKVVPSVLSMTFNAGQVCSLGTRLIVQAGVYEQVLAELESSLESIKQGDPFDDDVMMGPVINEAACTRILEMIQRGKSEGRLVTGGYRLDGDLADGYFIAPTIFESDNSAEISRNEVFGPVISIMKFDVEDEAVQIANDTDFDLAAYVFTNDLGTALRMTSALNSANVGINGGTAPASSRLPYGGRGQSGYGTQGGIEGVLEYVSVKTVQIAL